MTTQLGKKIATGMMTILIAAFFIPAVAGACQGRRGQQGKNCDMQGQKGMRHSMLGIWQKAQLVEGLALTPEQVNKLKTADFAAQEKGLALKAEMGTLRLKMEQAFAADTVDDKLVRDLAGKLAAVKGKMSVKKVEARLALKNLLTPEQIKKMKTLRQSRGMGKKGMNKPCNIGGQGMDKPCNKNRGRN